VLVPILGMLGCILGMLGPRTSQDRVRTGSRQGQDRNKTWQGQDQDRIRAGS
jgi:hypothetical protein